VAGTNLCVSPKSLLCEYKENKHVYYVNQRHINIGTEIARPRSTVAGK
jgi:hypothetical protein